MLTLQRKLFDNYQYLLARSAYNCTITKYFVSNPNVTIYKDEKGDNSCWQRFPVIIKNEKYINELEKTLNENNILYQWQNDKEVWELDMVKNYNTKIIIDNNKPKYLLIRTRQNELEDVKKLLKKK